MEESERFYISFLFDSLFLIKLVILCINGKDIFFVPFNLVFVNVVIFPEYAEVVTVRISVAVKNIKRLRNFAFGVFDVDELVAGAVNILRSAFENAVFKAAVFIKISNFLP